MQQIGFVIFTTLSGAYLAVASYLPRFFAGLIILVAGVLISRAVKSLVRAFLKALRVGKFLVQVKAIHEEEAFKVWEVLLAELGSWSLLILFLIPTFDAWGLPAVNQVLSGLILYLPNVFVAVVIGFVGVIVANLVHDLVQNSASGLDEPAAKSIAGVAYYAVLLSTALVVLSQLGVAADLVRIIFTGFVVMLAIAGGLAFGLGGKDLAAEILRGLREKLTK